MILINFKLSTVNHNMTPKDLVNAGTAIVSFVPNRLPVELKGFVQECAVLSRAVKWYAERRVLMVSASADQCLSLLSLSSRTATKRLCSHRRIDVEVDI